MKKIDWHCDEIGDETLINADYRLTQNVRRYFKKTCGDHFKTDREFMAWMKQAQGTTLRAAAQHWLRQQNSRSLKS